KRKQYERLPWQMPREPANNAFNAVIRQTRQFSRFPPAMHRIAHIFLHPLKRFERIMTHLSVQGTERKEAHPSAERKGCASSIALNISRVSPLSKGNCLPGYHR